MHDDVPVLPKDFDKEEATVKLNTLKDRLKKEHVVNFFENPDDLRAKVILSLGKIQKGGKKGKGYRPDPPPKPRNKLLHYLANRDILKTNLRIALECYRAHNSTAPFVCIMQGNRDDCIDKFIECLLSPDRDLEEAGVIPKALLWDEGPQKKRIRWPGGNKFKHYGVTQRKAYWFQMFFNKIEPKAKGARELAKAIEENKITQPLFVHTHIVTPHGTDEHAVLEKLLEEWAGFGSIGVHLIVFIIVHYKKEEPIVEETDSEYPSKRWWERLLNLFQSDRASQKKREQQIQEHVEAQAYDTKIRTYLETLTKIKEKQDKIDYSIAFKVSGEHLAGIWLGCLPELEKGDVKEFFGVHAERLGLGDKSEQELEEMVETWYKKADSLSMQAFVDKLEAIQQPNV